MPPPRRSPGIWPPLPASGPGLKLPGVNSRFVLTAFFFMLWKNKKIKHFAQREAAMNALPTACRRAAPVGRIATLAAMLVVVVILAPVNADQPCQQTFCGACKYPWSELEKWESCPTCTIHPCEEPGPPYLMCGRQWCTFWTYIGLSCAQFCQPEAHVQCIPWDQETLGCPCTEWWQCLFVE